YKALKLLHSVENSREFFRAKQGFSRHRAGKFFRYSREFLDQDSSVASLAIADISRNSPAQQQPRQRPAAHLGLDKCPNGESRDLRCDNPDAESREELAR